MLAENPIAIFIGRHLGVQAMPSMTTVNFNKADTGDLDDVMFCWNVDKKVGGSSSTFGLDVKLVQFLLFKFGQNGGAVMTQAMITGKWDAQSRLALSLFEETHKVVADGVVDRIIHHRALTQIHKVRFKILSLQLVYYKSVTGNDAEAFIRSGKSSDVETVLKAMPEASDDMPSDLKQTLIQARTDFLANTPGGD